MKLIVAPVLLVREIGLLPIAPERAIVPLVAPLTFTVFAPPLMPPA